MSGLVLIVEDEAPQAEMLSYNLNHEGFRTILVQNGNEALEAVAQHIPDVVIVDWMLPERSGIEICRGLRGSPETKNIPIIMLTARGEESDRILGFDAGADDYVVKPYSPREIVARVKALLRRSKPKTSEGHLTLDDIVLDIVSHKVSRAGQSIHLGPTEFKILRVLMEKPGRVYSRENLLDRAWGRDIYVESRTVDVHMRRLRKALNANGASDVIRTVRGAGYAIDSEIV
ncbi:MAG: phosphate regulon transcriptional regulator PhoB [Sneathiella sp.]|uniref:phosphate regulon transcriptional regulator PhoB n=1 Tax=Sneathiella sp. TaxID=1964365 RepID=UPI00300204EC